MPSKSLINFEKFLIKDVVRLIESHGELNHDGQGRRSLGHITRSGVVMLCAAWERYIEDVLVDSVKYLIEDIDLPRDLPLEIQKTLAKKTEKEKDELSCLDLAGDGWKGFYVAKIIEETDNINTPKSTIINDLFCKYAGLTNVSDSWSFGEKEINKFVKDRGEIAHTGSEAKYIQIGHLKNYKTLIVTSVVETDNFLADHLQKLSKSGKSPWRRRKLTTANKAVDTTAVSAPH